MVNLDIIWMGRTYDVTDEEGLGSVAMVAFEVDGDVDVDDIAVFQTSTEEPV